MKLGDICDVITKGTTPTSLGLKFSDEGINFIKIESISENGNFLEDKFAHISNECHQKLNRSQLKDGDLLFSIAGAIGRTAIVTQDILPANTNQALAIIRLNEKYYKLREIIYMYFNSPLIKIQYSRKKQGVAQLNLSLQDIKLLEIPEISEGRREEIVRNLKLIQALIDKRKRQLNSIDFLAKSRFLEMFGDVKHGNSKYKMVEISEFAKNIFAGGDKPKDFSLTKTSEYKFPVFSNGEKNDGLLCFSKESRVNEKAITISARGTLGFTLIRESNFTPVVRLITLVPKESCDIIYLKHCIEHLRIENSGSSQGQITVPNFKKLKIPFATNSDQNSFATFIQQLDKSKFRMKKCLKLFTYMRHL